MAGETGGFNPEIASGGGGANVAEAIRPPSLQLETSSVMNPEAKDVLNANPSLEDSIPSEGALANELAQSMGGNDVAELDSAIEDTARMELPGGEPDAAAGPDTTASPDTTAAAGPDTTASPDTTAAAGPDSGNNGRSTMQEAGFDPVVGTVDKDGKRVEYTSRNPNGASEAINQQKSPEQQARENRRNELKDKMDNGTASTEEIAKYNELNQDHDTRIAELKQKAAEGKLTDPKEQQELADLIKNKEDKGLTPEQQREKLNKEIEDLGTDIMTKMANGEEVSEEDLEKFRGLLTQNELMKQGMTSEQARKAVKEAFLDRGSLRKGERQGREAEELKKKIAELMSLELQIMTMPKAVDQLRQQREDVKKQAQAKHKEAESADGQERMRLKGEEYGLYMQIANINGRMVELKYKTPLLAAQQDDLEQYIRRRTGVTRGMGAVMEWGGAKTRLAVTEVMVNASEEWDNRWGNPR
jgi:hypothetical protein